MYVTPAGSTTVSSSFVAATRFLSFTVSANATESPGSGEAGAASPETARSGVPPPPPPPPPLDGGVDPGAPPGAGVATGTGTRPVCALAALALPPVAVAVTTTR